jgi:hypothetical protein
VANSSLQFKFTVSPVPVTVDVPTRLNIKKRRERVVYRTTSSQDNINLGYAIGTETTPAANLIISDRSTSLTQNRIAPTPPVITDTFSSVSLNVNKFLITDVFTEETPTLAATPLFFVHALRGYNSDLADFTDRTLLSISFANYLFQPITVSQYSLDTATGELYNNIENTYNSIDGSADITFVKYAVRIISGGIQTVEVYRELIDNSPVFEQADFDDVDAFGNILPGRKKYLIEELGSGTQFSITLPSLARYAYKETPESRLRVFAPTALDTSAPWNVRLTNGTFITSLQKTQTQYISHKYHVAEFNAQAFLPYPPYKQQFRQQATWITGTLVHVPKNIAADASASLFLDVEVRDSSRTLKYLYSTDPSKVGTLFTSTLRYTEGILSVDGRGGFIELLDTVRTDDEVSVTYYTKEEEYEFTAVDFNPINNLDILQQRVVVYVNPETYSTGDLDRTVYYLFVNQLGKITFSSQVAESPSALDPGTQKLLAEDFFADGSPRHTFYYDVESTASGLASRASGVNLDSVDDFSFIDKYTVESQLLSDQSAVTISGSVLDNFTENPRFLVLADVYVGESQAPDSLTKLDVRIQGGGIKSDSESAALALQPEAAWYWDLLGDRPYPSCNAFMVEIPQTILSDHGGSFSYQQVKDVVEKHMDIGGYPIVKMYGIDPVVTTCTTTSGTIQVCWPTYGTSVQYNVYYSLDINSGFVADNSSPLDDSGSQNCYTVSGLDASTKYYMKVGALDANDDESFGPTISATTTTSVAS